MFCPSCGSELADGARFCGRCGHEIEGSRQISAGQSGAEQPGQLEPARPESPAPEQSPAPEPNPAPSKHNVPKWLPIAGTAVAAVAVVVLFVLVLFPVGGPAGKTGDPAIPAAPKAAKAGDSWTVLVYMCGSDLESKHGAATKNIEELLTVELPANAHVVMETGGAKDWKNETVDAGQLGRYAVEGGKLDLLEQALLVERIASAPPPERHLAVAGRRRLEVRADRLRRLVASLGETEPGRRACRQRRRSCRNRRRTRDYSLHRLLLHDELSPDNQ